MAPQDLREEAARVEDLGASGASVSRMGNMAVVSGLSRSINGYRTFTEFMTSATSRLPMASVTMSLKEETSRRACSDRTRLRP